MRFFILPAIFTIASTFAKAQYHDSTSIVSTDSIKKVIEYAPYYSQTIHSSGNYFKTINDTTLFQFSSGISVFNVLRGQVPNLNIQAYAPHVIAAVRPTSYNANNSFLVIDGIPFNSSIGNYYNLNAFEFSSISVASSGNAVPFLDGPGNGAFFLTSRTGSGFAKPTFEFNSYTTYGWEEENAVSGNAPTTSKFWNLSNSIAYMQDFGGVDTRISYNFLAMPNSLTDNSPTYHNLKINTGADIGRKINIRVLLSGFGHSGEPRYGWTSGQGNSRISPTNEKQNFLHGNIAVRYKLNDWLRFSSQLSYSDRDSTGTLSSPTTEINLKKQDQRLLANVFANVEKPFGKYFSFSGFAGVQYSRDKVNEYNSGNVGTPYNKRTVETPSISGGAGLSFRRLMHVNFLYRMSEYDGLRDSSNRKSNYSISSSFIFSELIQWEPLSIGKIRASTGRSYTIPHTSYPYEEFGNGQLIGPQPVDQLEVGADIGFYNSKISLSINYFKNSVARTPSFKLNTRGWEVDARYFPVKRNNVTYQIGILLATLQSYAEISGQASDYSDPDWMKSLFNQVNFKNFAFSFLIENRKSALLQSSFTKLRDISIVYNLSLNNKSRIGLSKARISVSGRNLYVLANTGRDYEEYYSSSSLAPQKSVSLNLDVFF